MTTQLTRHWTMRVARALLGVRPSTPATTTQLRRLEPHSLPWNPSTTPTSHGSVLGELSAAGDDDNAAACPLAKERSEKGSAARPMRDLPGPVGWPIVGNFLTYLRKENRGQMHKVQARLHRKYGKMFREKWGPNWQLHLADPELIEQVYRHEGRYPNRPALQPWILYQQTYGHCPGIVTAQGTEWQSHRQTFGKRLLSPDFIRQMIEPVNHVTDDVIAMLRRVRDRDGDVSMTTSLPRIVHNWTLEASGSFLFETRLGCLCPTVPERTQRFIGAIHDMLESSLNLIVGERLHHRFNTRFWRRHKAAWDQLFTIAKELVDERISSIKNDGKDAGIYLTHLLDQKLDMQSIYSNIMDLLIAGTDTTASNYCFIVYLLANNQEVQNRLFDEVSKVANGRRYITNDDIERLVYLKCVIKESLRLYPTATMNCRILSDDLIVGGHRIPKQTLIVMNHYAASRDPEIFAEPDKFLPERWLRSSNSQTAEHHHPFATLPFGFGGRSCIGRRLAMMELATILAKTIQNFEIEVVPGLEFQPTLRTLLTPGDRVPVRFTDRRQLQLNSLDS